MPAMISVESTADMIHVHIPRAEVNDARLAQILRGLPLETVAAERMDEILARVPATPPVSGDERSETNQFPHSTD